MAIDPGILKAMRYRKGVSLTYIAKHIGLAMITLEGVEKGHLTAMDDVLNRWERIIIDAPAQQSWCRITRRDMSRG